jgi:hypothetical protein
MIDNPPGASIIPYGETQAMDCPLADNPASRPSNDDKLALTHYVLRETGRGRGSLTGTQGHRYNCKTSCSSTSGCSQAAGSRKA